MAGCCLASSFSFWVCSSSSAHAYTQTDAQTSTAKYLWADSHLKANTLQRMFAILLRLPKYPSHTKRLSLSHPSSLSFNLIVMQACFNLFVLALRSLSEKAELPFNLESVPTIKKRTKYGKAKRVYQNQIINKHKNTQKQPIEPTRNESRKKRHSHKITLVCARK